MIDCEVCIVRDICPDVGNESEECEHKFRLDYTEYYCILRCGYYNIDHCGLQSSKCATDIFNHRLPSRYQHRSEVMKLMKDVKDEWSNG